MRRILMLAAVVAVAVVALVGATLAPAGAGGNGDSTMIVIRKTVQGPATGGFTVVVSCDPGGVNALNGSQTTLNFDASGVPTTFSGSNGWSIVEGAWKSNEDSVPPEPVPCTATETDADGAQTTTWTCDYVFMVVNGDMPAGCDAPSGTGTGPVGFTLGDSKQVDTQVATVHFTNTLPEAAPAAAAVTAAPTFTG